MEKKFKCQSCGQSFIGDTSKYVTCPNCKSDNVAIDAGKSKIINYLLVAAGSIVLILLIVFAVKYIKKSDSKGDSIESISQVEDQGETANEEVSQAEVDAVAQNMAPEIAFERTDQPKYDPKTETYSLNVKAHMMGGNIDNTSIVYTLATINDVEVAKSDNGQFKGIPPVSDKSNPDCSYIVYAQAMRDNKVLENGKISKIIAGFVVVPKASSVTKLTVAQVQSLIDRKAGASEISANQSLTHPCAVRCQGTMENASAVKSLTKLIERLDMDEDMSVKVVSLEYDDLGRVKCVVFTPSYK